MDDNLNSGLTAEDHAYRNAAQTYFNEKAQIARDCFEAKQFEVFLEFEDHWRDFFAPSLPASLREYLAMPFEVRTAQFERFKRECRSWEVSFRHAIAHAQARSAARKESDDLKRRLDSQRARTDEVRSLYHHLDSMLGSAAAQRVHPPQLVGHLRALGVPLDASLVDIKKQYKRLAKLHHPDKKGDAIVMSRINDAYRAIMDYYKVA